MPLSHGRCPKPATILAVAVGACSFVVYALTAARSVSWGDSAEFVAVARTLGIAHPPGYPLYTLLASAVVRAPIGTPFLRLSLLSAAAGGAAAAIASLIAWELAGNLGRTGRGVVPLWPRAAGSVVAGLAFAFSPTLWSQSTVPEVYSLAAFLILSVLLLLLVWLRAGSAANGQGGVALAGSGPGLGERALPLMALTLGLALAHHLTALLVVPSVVVALSCRARRGPAGATLAGAAVLLACGLALYAYLPLRSLHDPAVHWARIDSWGALTAHVSGAQYASRLFARPLPLVFSELREFLVGLPTEFPWPILVLAAVGLAVLWTRSRAVFAVVLLEMILVVAHAVNYRIPDVESYYIPAYGLLAVVAGLGVSGLGGAGRVARPARFAALSALVLVVAVPLVARVDSGWPVRDLRASRGAARFAGRLLDSAEPGIVLAQNDRTVFLLWHDVFVLGRRDDLAVIDIRGRAPHFEKWFPEIRFPTEQELARHFGRSEDQPCDPPAREAFPVGAYLPLLVELNQDSVAVYADVDLAVKLFPMRSLPSGLLVRVTPDTIAAIPPELIETAIRPPGLSAATPRGSVDRKTAQAYAKVIGDFGELFLVRGDVEAAVAALERARDVAPEIAPTHNNLGVAYLRAGRVEDGVREIGEALRLDPGLAAGHYSLYGVLRGIGDLGRAVSELEAAVKLDREHSGYRLELAASYEEAGRLGDAERILRGLERSDPQSWAVRLASGDFLARQRRYSEAVAAYRRADELNPGSPGILCNLGRCYWELADVDRAVEAMRRSVELQPQNPRLKYDLAEMLHCAGEPSEALAHLNDVIRILPGMWKARALKATILGERGHYSDARRLFQEAWELGADDTSFWGAWSAMEGAAGDTGRARQVAQGLE